MALTTPNLWFSNGLLGFLAVSRDLHPALKQGFERTRDSRSELHVLTGVGACNGRDRTTLAQVTRPGLA